MITLLHRIINKLFGSKNHVQNYVYDKDGLIPPFNNNIGGKNERIEKGIKSRKNS